MMSSIQFVGTAIAGNIAAPLETNSCWVTGADADLDDDSDSEVSARSPYIETKEPFTFGLVDSHEQVDLKTLAVSP